MLIKEISDILTKVEYNRKNGIRPPRYGDPLPTTLPAKIDVKALMSKVVELEQKNKKLEEDLAKVDSRVKNLEK